MIRIGILGDIGSGKTHVAKSFGYPVFNADNEVSKLYKKSRKCYTKLSKALPNHINTFPVKKNKLYQAVVEDITNLKKITKILKHISKILKQIYEILKNSSKIFRKHKLSIVFKIFRSNNWKFFKWHS